MKIIVLKNILLIIITIVCSFEVLNKYLSRKSEIKILYINA